MLYLAESPIFTGILCEYSFFTSGWSNVSELKLFLSSVEVHAVPVLPAVRGLAPIANAVGWLVDPAVCLEPEAPIPRENPCFRFGDASSSRSVQPEYPTSSLS